MEAQWEFCTAFFPKKLIDGTRSRDVVMMRQWVQGRWIYRELNESEKSEWAYHVAW